MTPNYMKYVFLNELDRMHNLSAPGYDDRQISDFLNRGMDETVMYLYNPLGNKYQKGFEANEKRKRDLNELISFAYIKGNHITGNRNLTGVIDSATPYIVSIYFPTGETTLNIAEGVEISTVDGVAIPVEVTDIQTSITTRTVITQILEDIYSNNILVGIKVKINNPTVGTGNLGIGNTNFILTGLGKSSLQFGAHKNGIILDLPPLYMYTVEEQMLTDESANTYVNVKPIPHDYYYANINNPLSKPYYNLGWRLNVSRANKGLGTEDDDLASGNDRKSFQRVEIIVNDKVLYPLKEYAVRYVKYPRRIVVDEFVPERQVSCELDESIHHMIIQAAVRIASGTTQPEKYALYDAEEKKTE